MSAIAVEIVGKPLFTGSNMLIEYKVTSDANGKVAMDITGVAVLLLLTDPSGTTYSYTGSNDAGTGGTGSWTLAQANHSTAGTATAQVHLDGIPKAEFEFEFRTKKAAT